MLCQYFNECVRYCECGDCVINCRLWEENATPTALKRVFRNIIFIVSCDKKQQSMHLFTTTHFTLYYQQHHLPQLTLKQLSPFSWLTTPLSLRRTIGRCSWSLRNEESKGLGERLCLPYTITPLIFSNTTLTIVSPRNSVRVVFLIARGWRGTSLPRGNVCMEIQRHRCWAFSEKTWL